MASEYDVPHPKSSNSNGNSRRSNHRPCSALVAFDLMISGNWRQCACAASASSVKKYQQTRLHPSKCAVGIPSKCAVGIVCWFPVKHFCESKQTQHQQKNNVDSHRLRAQPTLQRLWEKLCVRRDFPPERVDNCAGSACTAELRCGKLLRSDWVASQCTQSVVCRYNTLGVSE